ncbi:MAG: hypothetical protein KAX15_02705 [Candidatus Omnitrophica bacterium]|nr:hypothetical protein [Candidatus Omnitrophota bacterium]
MENIKKKRGAAGRGNRVRVIGRAIVEKFRGDYKTRAEAILAEGKPYAVMKGCNIALNVGLNEILTLMCGGGGSGAVFSNANARLGVGASTTTPAATQTGLLAQEVVDDAEANWTAESNVTSALDPGDKKVGSNSVKLTVASAFTTGLLAYHDFSSMDLSDYLYIRFWIKSSVARAAGDLRLVLDNTAGCVSPLETLDIPALSAGVWTEVSIALADPSLLTAVISVGLDASVDPGVCDIKIDDIKAVSTWYKGMEASYPIYGSDQKATFRSVFGSAEGNHPWKEWTVDNGLADGPVSLNRGSQDFGIKIAGETRTLTVEFTLTPE